MNKKEFIALANVIRANPATFSREAVKALADFCAQQNPNFKPDRWLDYIAGHCGPNGGKVK